MLRELYEVCRLPDADMARFAERDTSTLIIHIVDRHHACVRHALPALMAYANKIATVHGGAGL